MSPPITATADSSHPTVRNFAARLFGASKTSAGSSGNAVEDLESAGPDISRVAVLDPELTFVAWHGAFSGGVKAVFAASVPNSTTLAPHVLTTRGNLVRLTEVPVQTMIQTMERQGRFVMALGLAKNRGVDEAGVAEIHRVYGDYMYGKGDGDGAMAQYVQTVGFVRPSYVIRKVSLSSRLCYVANDILVLGRATNFKPRDISPSAPFEGACKCRSYNPIIKYLYQTQGCGSIGSIYQI